MASQQTARNKQAAAKVAASKARSAASRAKQQERKAKNAGSGGGGGGGGGGYSSSDDDDWPSFSSYCPEPEPEPTELFKLCSEEHIDIDAIRDAIQANPSECSGGEWRPLCAVVNRSLFGETEEQVNCKLYVMRMLLEADCDPCDKCEHLDKETPVHIAARKNDVLALKMLFTSNFCSDSLKKKNERGQTPLQVITSSQTQIREILEGGLLDEDELPPAGRTGASQPPSSKAPVAKASPSGSGSGSKSGADDRHAALRDRLKAKASADHSLDELLTEYGGGTNEAAAKAAAPPPPSSPKKQAAGKTAGVGKPVEEQSLDELLAGYGGPSKPPPPSSPKKQAAGKTAGVGKPVEEQSLDELLAGYGGPSKPPPPSSPKKPLPKTTTKAAATGAPSGPVAALAPSSAGDGNTPLMLALMNGDEDEATKLLANGADVDAVNSRGETPFLLACRYCSRDMVEALKDEGASHKDVDKNGDNAFVYARQNTTQKSGVMMYLTNLGVADKKK